MISVLILGCIWTIYGIAGLMGFQVIPDQFEGHSWTKEYKRKQGISWLMLSIPDIVLSIVIEYVVNYVKYMNFSPKLVFILLILCGIPSFTYSLYIDRQYKAKLEKGDV